MGGRTSAGLVLHRVRDGRVEVLLVHPGGPLWKNKDAGAWSIPKGEYGPGEDALAAARREFEEETGLRPEGPFEELRPVKLRSGKVVRAWAVRGDCDPGAIRSNSVRMEWPPRSGRSVEFPEVDRAAFFTIDEARLKLNPGQVPLLDDLLSKLEGGNASA
jgi:predicted NUDIX family NTP pyrophosphohydrolase